MRDLHVVALSGDGQHLVLATRSGVDVGEFRVAVDDRLSAALRGQLPRPGTSTPPSVTPKEIQARLRAGESVEQIAVSAGVPASRIERFAGPVLSERERMITGARDAVVARPRRGPSDLPLGRAVDQHLGEYAGYRPEDTVWSARRVDAGRWVVEVSWVARGRERTAGWTYDPGAREAVPLDAGSAALAHVDLGEGVASRPARPPVRRAAPAPSRRGTARRTSTPTSGAAAPQARAVPGVDVGTAVAPGSAAAGRTAGKVPAAKVPAVAVPPKPAGAAAAKAAVAKAPRKTAEAPPHAPVYGPTAPVAPARVAKAAARAPAAAPAAKATAKTTTRAPTAKVPAARAAAAKDTAKTTTGTPAAKVPARKAPAAKATATVPAAAAVPAAPAAPSTRASSAAPGAARRRKRPPTGRPEVAQAVPSGPPVLRVVRPVEDDADHRDTSHRDAAGVADHRDAARDAGPRDAGDRNARDPAAGPSRARRAAGARASVPDWADVLLGTGPAPLPHGQAPERSS